MWGQRYAQSALHWVRKPGAPWIESGPAPQPVWVIWRGEISLTAAALLTGRELVLRVVMDWHINVTFTLQQSTKAQRGDSGTAVLFFNLGSRCRLVFNPTLRPLYLREWPETHCIEGWLVRSGRCGKSRPLRIRSPDWPDRIESLNRLSYLRP
jgi:hypothetical protein